MRDDTVCISLDRYDELLDIETRVNVVVERIQHERYLDNEAVLWILGTDLAVETALELREIHHKSEVKK